MGFDILDGIDTLAPRTVGIEQFVESSDFCDIAAYPRQLVFLKLVFLEEMTGEEEDVLTEWINGGRNGSEISISPNIRERRDYLREHGYKHFRQMQMAIGRRASKGFCTGTIMSKIMYDTCMLGDPGQYYGIQSPNIYFSCIAGSEAQAKKFQYADFVSRVETNKAFQSYISESLETELRVYTPNDIRHVAAAQARGNKVKRDQATLRGNALAANAGTLRGSATMVCVLDEAAHMIAGESKSSVSEVYAAALPSLDQFGIDGFIAINSSPYSQVGIFYDLYQLNMLPFDPTRPVDMTGDDLHDEDGIGSRDISKLNGDPRSFAFRGPSWSFFQGYRYHTSKYKPRERGRIWGKMVTVSPDWIPEEVDSQERPLFSEEDKAAILQARASEAADPETYKVERRGKFAEVAEAWLNPSMVDRMYAGRPIGLQHNQDTGDILMGYEPFEVNYGVGVATNMFRYKFHLDPSSTTAGFGFAIAHIEYLPDIVTGIETEHAVFDLIRRWRPQDFPGGVIRWKDIIDQVITYAKIFNPFEITMDQHQSAAPLQEISDKVRANNIQCQVYERGVSPELNWKKSEVFKTALYQGLVHAPFNENADPFTSKEELKFLQQIQTSGRFPRVDKQDTGEVQVKDRADSVIDCVWALLGNLQLQTMRDRLSNSSGVFGSPGGYGLGQVRGNPGGLNTPPQISELYSRRDEQMTRMGVSPTGVARGNMGARRAANRGSGRARGRW